MPAELEAQGCSCRAVSNPRMGYAALRFPLTIPTAPCHAQSMLSFTCKRLRAMVLVREFHPPWRAVLPALL
jgi:hypothetical protein